jgi:halocyanin-like protein
MKRREFMRTAGGATVAAGATAGAIQPVAAAEEGGDSGGGGGEVEPAFGSYLDDANLYDTTKDLRDQDEVTVEVGAGEGFAFNPPTIWISPGTTVTWEWTGNGGGHNVVTEEGPAGFNQPDVVGEAGYTYEYEFTEEDAGITTYKCEPHEAQGMKGGVAVGDDVETIEVGGGADIKKPIHFGVHPHEHWVGVSVMLLMSVSLVFTFFTLKYGESPHTSGGD